MFDDFSLQVSSIAWIICWKILVLRIISFLSAPVHKTIACFSMLSPKVVMSWSYSFANQSFFPILVTYSLFLVSYLRWICIWDTSMMLLLISVTRTERHTLYHPVLSASYDEFILVKYLVNDTNMFLYNIKFYQREF